MDLTIVAAFASFIAKERECYDGEDNNKVAFSLGQIARYLRFVDIVYRRYKEASDATASLMRCRLDDAQGKSGSRAMNANDHEMFKQAKELDEHLHLEIESFFIFTKIALDKIAHFIEDYFGPARGQSLKSHDKWRKSSTDYARIKGIDIPAEMLAEMDYLQDHVVKYRDKLVTHLRSPRAVFPTFVSSNGGGQLGVTHLYPRESDSQEQSPVIADVLRSVDAYLTQLMILIVSNRALSRYNVCKS